MSDNISHNRASRIVRPTKCKDWEGWTNPALKKVLDSKDQSLFYYRGHMWDVESLRNLIDALEQLENGYEYLSRMNWIKRRAH